MIKALVAAGGVLLVAGALLVAPGLVDWTDYRLVFAERLSAATGRPVTIDGDLDFVLLPRPAFNADEVRIAGNVADDFLAVKRLSARLAFLPLLRGDLEFRELVLRQPEARVTRNTDGAVDFLNMTPPQIGQPPAVPPLASTPFNLNVDRVLIDGGMLTYQDVASGTATNLQGMNLTILARPAAVSVTGDVTVANIPLTVDAAVGRAGAGGTRTVSVALKLSEADASARFSGLFSDAAGRWDVRGDLNIASASSGALLAAFGVLDAGTPIPQALLRPLSLVAKIRGTPETFSADPLSLDVGGTPAKGTVTWQAATSSHLDVKIDVGTVEVEAWSFADAQPTSRDSFTFVRPARAQETSGQALSGTGDAVFAPFKNLTANLNLRMPVLSYRGQTLRDGVVMASFARGALTISEASVELPGATRAKAFGIVRHDEGAVFEGAVDVQTGDLRNMLAWLGLNPDPAKVLPGRLSNASFRAALQGTPAHLTLADMTATFDTSTITGRMSWARGPRPTIGLDLAVNTFNADAYWPLFAGLKAGATTAPAANSGPAAGYGVTPTFAAFSSLADIDAEMRFQIDSLTAGGIANGKVGLDLGLKDASLNIRSASFENIGGVTAWFSGAIGGFGVTPRFDDVQFDLSAGDLARVGRAFGFNVPQALRAGTLVSLTGVMKGSLAQAGLTATLKAAGLTAHVDGEALTLDQQPHVSVNLDVSQPSYANFMKTLGMPWPINLPDPGPLKLTARVTYDFSDTKVESLGLRIGDNALNGDLQITRKPGKPEITGTLSGIVLAVDKLWPKAPAIFTPASSQRQGVGATAAMKPAPWSEEAFDWRFLKGWQGNIQLSGPSFSLRGVQVRDFVARLLVADDAGELTEWNGKVFGVPGQIYLRLAATPEPTVQGEIGFLGGDLAAAAAAVNGGESNSAGLKPSGKADFAGSFRAQGATPAALVAALSGSASVKITASETGSGVVSGLLGAVAAASRLESTVGSRTAGVVTLESRVSAADGRIKVEDATVASKSYGGAFSGTIDLPRWLVDITGKLRLEAGGSGDATRPTLVPITVKGALDLPNIMLLPPT